MADAATATTVVDRLTAPTEDPDGSPARRRPGGALGLVGRKLAHLIVVLLLVSLGTFFLLQLTPGNPAANILGTSATPQAVRQVDHQLGLDRPLLNQYGTWLGHALEGNLGQSLVPPGGSVLSRIGQALPVTLELAILAQILALAIAVPLGILAAYRAGTRLDAWVSGTTYGLVSIPPFVTGLVLAYLFSVKAHFFPRAEWVRISQNFWSNLHSAFLPALTLALGLVAVYARLLRNDLIVTLQSDFIAAARARGLPTWRILTRHALRPSSLSLVTLAGVSLGTLLGGAAVVEVIYALPGLGRMLVDAVGADDYPLVQGTILLVATAYVVLNTLIDLAQGLLDPRTRRGNR